MGNQNGTRLVELSIAMLDASEAQRLLDVVNQALSAGAARPDALALLKRADDAAHSTAFSSLVLHVSRIARQCEQAVSAATRAPQVRSLINLRERLLARQLALAVADTTVAPEGADAAAPVLSVEEGIRTAYRLSVGRTPVAEEIEIWKRNFANGLPFHEFLLLMSAGPEAKKLSAGLAIAAEKCDGEAVQLAYETVLGRGASGWEIAHWVGRLEAGSVTRADMLAALFHTSLKLQADMRDAPVNDGLTCYIMGTGTFLSADDWQRQARELAEKGIPEPEQRYANRFPIRREKGVLVSALCSLYRGGDFIEQFMDNITSQSCFRDYAELVIVDADSPEDEYETIKRYLAKFPNINYLRMNYRIGIYDAWNVAAKAARGEYLTNTNLDDLRRIDSLEIQAGALDNVPFADVVYQDLYYSFDPRLPFEQVAAFGHKTRLPVITPHNMIKFNSPHNAPMWRKRLHDELGWFDTRYKSAGDHEFWMRCLAAGKQFWKINDPHVVYYQNPKGLSTRPDTRGVVEAMDIHKTYCRKIIPREMVAPTEEFRRILGPVLHAAGEGQDRYAMAHDALRNLGRTARFGRGREVRA